MYLIANPVSAAVTLLGWGLECKVQVQGLGFRVGSLEGFQVGALNKFPLDSRISAGLGP